MNNSLVLFVLVVLCSVAPSTFLFGQEGVIKYRYKSHGENIKNAPPLLVSYKNNKAVLHSKQQKQQQFIDYEEEAIFKTLFLNDENYTNRTSFDALEKATLKKDTATILGYPVKKAHLVQFSNSIDVWYTKELSIKGTPDPMTAPQLGTILKIVRNGNQEIVATDIQEGKIPDSLDASTTEGELVNEAKLRALEIKDRYTTIPIFDKEQINFGDSIFNPKGRQSDTVYRFANGTVIAKKVHLPEDFNGKIFASLTQHANGDAYDRTGAVFVMPMKDSITFLDALQNGVENLPGIKDSAENDYRGFVSTEHYTPPVELIRFFTPFGVRAYNDKREIAGYTWADSVTYTQEVSELSSLLKGDVWIGAYIGNYDKEGHTVSLDLNYYPGRSGADDYVQPLFNTLNIMEMDGQNYARLFRTDSLTFKAHIPKGVSDLKLRYISTGHGGWGGGDEFNPKENTVIINDEKVFSYTPWRSDCATYRLKNPSSGNFENGLSSSDLSRSGWCPGTATNPVDIPLPDLKPGVHTITVAIPQGAPEGDSFSFWNISGTLIGKFK